MRVCVHPSVVWFKRDLRTVDHRLLVVEPELWAQPDASHRHYAFICQCRLSLPASTNPRSRPS